MFVNEFTTTHNIKLSSIIFKLSLLLCFGFLISACNEKTAEDYYQEALVYSKSGDTKSAIVALKNAVQEAPRMAKARFELGKLNLALREYETASKELARALEFSYAESEVIPKLALAFQRSGANVALADMNYQPASLTKEEHLEVGYRQLQALTKLEQKERATLLINTLLLIEIDTPYKGLVRAYQQIGNEQHNEALEITNTLLVDSPYNKDIVDLAARLYILAGQPNKAAELYENYLKEANYDVELKLSLANILIKTQPAKAEVYIDELLLINSNNGSLNKLKAISRAAAKDYEAAKHFAEKAINSGQSDLNLRLIAGFAAYELEEYQVAIRHLSVVAESLPDDHPALRMLAFSQIQLNMGESAGELLSQVRRVENEDISLFSRAGYELIKAGNLEAAREIIEKTEKVTQSAEDLTKLGVLKLSMNDLEGIVDLESAIAKSPKSIRAKTTLANAYLGTKQLQKAMSLAKRWQKDEPNIVDGYLLEAKVLALEEKYSQASEILSQATKIDAQNTDVQLASIRIDILEKKYEQGINKAEKFLQQNPDNAMALGYYFQLMAETGDAQGAMIKIEQAANRNTNDQALILLAARTLVISNQFEDALLLLNNIKANRTTPNAYWELKGTALFSLKQTEEAITHYKKWVSYYPKKESPTIALLTVLGTQNEYAEAAAIAAGFRAESENLQIKLMHAYFLVMSKDTKGAKAVLASLDSQYQIVPFVRGIKARIALLERRGALGIEDARISFMANKKPENLFVYIQTLESAGQIDKAYNILQQHVLEFPLDIRSKSLLAERQVARDPATALNTYENMLKDYPNNPVFLNNAGYLHMKSNNMEKAYEYSLKAYNISPENVSFTDTYAQQLMRRGDTNKAVEAYNKVMSDTVVDEEIILNYIEALLENNNILTAKRTIQDFNSKLKSEESRDRLLVLQAEFLQ
jgi:putative PEP-CTERM system TPR-repeat lipoprotein